MVGTASTPRRVLGLGVYTIESASWLLGIAEQTIIRWGHTTQRRPQPLLRPTHGWAYSFHDLVSLAVIAVLRQRQVPERNVARALRELEDITDEPRPLARRDVVDQLATAGVSVLLGDLDLTQSRQTVIIETLSMYLQPIVYDDDSLLARLWKPSLHVVVDPEVQVGRPCIEGTRVTTDVVASRVEQGESVDLIARDLDLSRAEIADAIGFEKRLLRGHGLAALPAA